MNNRTYFVRQVYVNGVARPQFQVCWEEPGPVSKVFSHWTYATLPQAIERCDELNGRSKPADVYSYVRVYR